MIVEICKIALFTRARPGSSLVYIYAKEFKPTLRQKVFCFIRLYLKMVFRQCLKKADWPEV